MANVSLLLALAACIVACTSAFDWPMYGQNINRTGYAGGDMASWVKRETHRVGAEVQADWVLPIPGAKAGYSPIVIKDGIAYTGTDANLLYAIEIDTGKVAWTFAVGGVIHGSAVITSDNHVVFPAYDGFLYKLTTAGKLVWKQQVKAGYSSPLVDEAKDRIFLGTNDNSTIAVTLSTGSLVWTSPVSNIVTSSATPYGDYLFIGGNDAKFYKLDANTGKILFSFQTGRVVEAAASVATFYGKPYILFPSWDHNLYAFDPEVTGTNTAALWTYPVGNPIEAHPTIVGNTIFFTCEDNSTYALDVGTDGKPSKKWTFRMGAESDSSVAVSSNGVAFFGSADTFFYGVTAADGKLMCKVQTKGDVFSSPALSEKMVVFASAGGNIYGLSISKCT